MKRVIACAFTHAAGLNLGAVIDQHTMGNSSELRSILREELTTAMRSAPQEEGRIQPRAP